MKINTKLPIFRREVYDFSMMSTHQRCPMKGFQQYGLARAAVGVNFPIQYGVAYHKFREILDKAYLAENPDLKDQEWRNMTFALAFGTSCIGFVEPPIGHKKDYLTESRLLRTCEDSFANWIDEKASGRYKVLFTEQPFDLKLPSGRRFGGRFDQILEWNGRLWVRDYKTVSRMGKTYGTTFDPNNQMTGYVWAAQMLSGRPVEGVIVDVVYNTKTKGPTFHEFLTTRSEHNIERWIATVERELVEIEGYYDDMVFPMRTGACNDYSGCYFRGACQKSSWPATENWLLANTKESHWDFANPEGEEGVTD